ncbi:MAG: Efflux transporter, family, subunit [Verrucomicrobiales bacterium]|nr:Efflux transporter, family, subunit [Verrucomicrobiales bacterium]
MNRVETTSSPQRPAGAAVSAYPGARKGAPRLWLWALCIIIILGIGLVVGLLPRLRNGHQLQSETREMAVTTVSVVFPVPGKALSGLSLAAEVRPATEARIYARANGFIKKWYNDIGSVVQAGQVLADIDAPELEQELASATAGLGRSQAALGLAQTTAARWADLLKSASVSEQEAAEKTADLALKKADVEASEAAVRRLERLLSFTHVTAPFSGTVTGRRIDVGDLIATGKELYSLADMNTLRVFVRVPQSAAGNIVTNGVASLLVPENAGHSFTATVARTSGMIDPDSRTLLTELTVDNQGHQILAGSYAEVRFPDIKQNVGLLIPSTTLIFRAEGTQVGIVDGNNKVQLKTITIGRDFGKTFEVLAGLSASDKVINNPSDSLTAGVTVRISEMQEGETPQ